METEEPKTVMFFFFFFFFQTWAPFDEKCLPLKNVLKQQVFPLHTDAHITDSSHQYMRHSLMFLKSQVFTRILRALWSFPRWYCAPLKRWQSLVWATRRSRPRWDCTVEFQPPCMFPRSLSFRLLFMERAKDTARSVSDSFQSRRIAGSFDPRVSQSVDKQPLDVRESG